MVLHATPKVSPDLNRWSLNALLQAHYNPGSWELSEAAEHSVRAIEVINAARPSDRWRMKATLGGVVVPDVLLARSMGLIQAAITTRTTASGVDDDRVAYDSVIGALIGIGEVLPHCRVFTGLEPPEGLPQLRFPDGSFRNVAENVSVDSANTGVGTLGAALANSATALTLTLNANASETVSVGDYLIVGNEIVQVTAVASQSSFTVARAQVGTARAAHAGAAAVALVAREPATLYALSGEKKTLTPHTIRGSFRYTPEVAIGSRMQVGRLGIDEGIRQMADQVETELALGDGMNGRVTGFESALIAAHAEAETAALGNSDLHEPKILWLKASQAKVPVPGRFWVFDPEMNYWARGRLRGGYGSSLIETMEGDAIVESSRITGSPFSSAGDKGVAWLLYGPDITVGFFGEDTEVSIQRVNATGEYDVVMLKFWDVAFRRDVAVWRFRIQDP